MSEQEIREIIERDEYEFYGLRCDDAEYGVGSQCNNSHNWYQDDPNEGLDEDDPWFMPYNKALGLWDGGELNGTCAVMVSADTVNYAIKALKSYALCGKNAYLIAGDYAQGGNDSCELIISDAIVLAKIR